MIFNQHWKVLFHSQPELLTSTFSKMVSFYLGRQDERIRGGNRIGQDFRSDISNGFLLRFYDMWWFCQASKDLESKFEFKCSSFYSSSASGSSLGNICMSPSTASAACDRKFIIRWSFRLFKYRKQRNARKHKIMATKGKTAKIFASPSSFSGVAAPPLAGARDGLGCISGVGEATGAAIGAAVGIWPPSSFSARSWSSMI